VIAASLIDFGLQNLLLMEKCVDAMSSSKSVFECSGGRSRGLSTRVPLELLGNDITFGYMRVFQPTELDIEPAPFAKGGFGCVFRAKLPNGTTVVCKELLISHAAEGFLEFQREVGIMSQLKHRNIVGLFGVMMRPLSMVLEYCQGGDLYHALGGGKVKDHAVKMRIAFDISCGMAYLHSHHLAHRDLRSPNVLLASLDPKAEVSAPAFLCFLSFGTNTQTGVRENR
jgi:hypothetical protein